MIRSLTLVALATLSSTALAVPMTLQHQGRLLDSSTGLPVDGTQDIRFAFYDVASGGTELWSETHTVSFDDGYFSLSLGEMTPLDSAVFQNNELWVETQVGLGAPLPTRLQLHSVPFAIRAGNADTATNVDGGVVNASEIQIDGTTVIDGSGQLQTDVDWADLQNKPSVVGEFSGCGAGDVATFDGTDWACGPLPTSHSVATTDLTGIIDVSNLPIGGGASEVAAGDHTHAPVDIVGIMDVAQLPVGTGSNNVAAGDHGHTAADVGALPTGTTAADIGALPTGTTAADIGALPTGTTAADIGALPTGTTAADIGALPTSTTAADIGALPASTTAADIGAAPASSTGGVIVGDDSSPCDSSSQYGIVRWNTTDAKLQVCTDTGWYDLSGGEPDGGSAANAAASCKQLHVDYPLAPSGVYYVNPTGSAAYEVYCNMTDYGGGWTLMLKAKGAAYHYDWAGWTNGNVYNASTPSVSWSDAKYQAYNDLPISELLLSSELGNKTHLSIPTTDTLRSLMGAPTTLLDYQAGSANATHLVHGEDPTTVCGRAFRINTYAYTNFQTRLGGHFVYQWSCGYGTDAAGEACAAEAAGFGIRDRRWNPWTNGDRGFGIRQAHDYTNYSAGDGQLSTGGMIWAR